MTAFCRILVLLLLATCLGCGESGPKQTLEFRASPLPGASGPVDLDTTLRMVKSRVTGAKIRKRTKCEKTASGIDVIVYGATADELEKIKSYVTSTVTLELAAVAYAKYNADLATRAEEVKREVTIDGEVHAEWIPVATKPDGTPLDEFMTDPDVISRDRDDNGQTIREWLIVYEPGFRVTGDLFRSANVDMEPGTGRPCLSFAMNPEGSANLSMLTRSIRLRRLAIVLDGKIHSAPTVQSTISERGQITGNFTIAEVERTAALLQAGKFPCQLTFVEVKNDKPAK